MSGTAYLDFADFADVISEHDKFEFGQWDMDFKSRAEKVGAFFDLAYKGSPIPSGITGETVKAALAAGMKGGANAKANPQTVYNPWDGWWCGKWSNGTTYYHIWDPTVSHGKDWVQLVSQSGSAFVHKDNIESYRGSVDLAINVAGSRGLTGWVKKSDGHYPHIAYLLQPKTLLWIMKPPKGDWFMFVEWSNGSTYQIEGRQFTVVGQEIGPMGEKASSAQRHYGTYTKQNPEMPSCAK